MGNELETQLQSLRQRQQTAVRAHAQAQARLEQAEQQHADELEALGKLGFTSVKEAEAFLQKADSEIQERLEKIAAQLP